MRLGSHTRVVVGGELTMGAVQSQVAAVEEEAAAASVMRLDQGRKRWMEVSLNLPSGRMEEEGEERAMGHGGILRFGH
jgi:hypothetical protein